MFTSWIGERDYKGERKWMQYEYRLKESTQWLVPERVETNHMREQAHSVCLNSTQTMQSLAFRYVLFSALFFNR